jgi:hypothetical protein
MSTAEQFSPQEGVTAPTLVEVPPTESAAAYFAQLEQKAPFWPDLQISFSEQNLFGSSILPTNRIAQTRTVIGGVVAAAEQANNNNPGDLLPKLDIEASGIDAQLKSIDRFLSSTHDIEAAKKPAQEILPFAVVKVGLLRLLASHNHPLWQAMQEVRILNAQRAVKSALSASRPPTLDELAVDRLENDVLKVAFAAEIRDFYGMWIQTMQGASRGKA